jgi:hypothetical protein
MTEVQRIKAKLKILDNLNERNWSKWSKFIKIMLEIQLINLSKQGYQIGDLLNV